MSFIQGLDAECEAHLRRIDALQKAEPVPADQVPGELKKRLMLALRQELEAAELAALWIPSTAELDVKLALGKLCGDEVKHYRLILHRLQELGVDTAALDPRGAEPTPLYIWLASLADTVERVSAAMYTREHIGYIRNEQFIEWCTQQGDTETARLYRDAIQPDELAHVQHGRAFLERYATTDEAQAKATAAARRTLEMAEGLVQKLVSAQHLACAPGC